MRTPILLTLLIFSTQTTFARGVSTIIAGDSYSGGEVGIKLEKLFRSRKETVARYGISSSRVFHWLEKNEKDTTMGEGVGWPDWMSPGREGQGHAPSDYPRLRSILQGEGKNATKLVIILGTNGVCEKRTLADAAALAAQVMQAMPNIRCFWVGPKLFTGVCNGSIKNQKVFSTNLETALGSHCKFINSTKLKIRIGNEPHDGDFANEWANAVAQEFP